MNPSICVNCGDPLKVRVGAGGQRRMYCSRSCSDNHRRGVRCEPGGKMTLNCQWCGKSWVAIRKKKFCCADCRTKATAKRLEVQRKCAICGTEFVGKSQATACCSTSCSQKWRYKKLGRSRDRICRQCGKPFLKCRSGSTSGTFCSRECSFLYLAEHRTRPAKKKPTLDQMRAAAHGNHRRRARKYGVPYEPVNKMRVFARDRWQCQLCLGLVDRSKMFPHPASPSLDHVVAMEHGGPHTEANVQCAHLCCNLEKAATEGRTRTAHLSNDETVVPQKSVVIRRIAVPAFRWEQNDSGAWRVRRENVSRQQAPDSQQPEHDSSFQPTVHLSGVDG